MTLGAVSLGRASAVSRRVVLLVAGALFIETLDGVVLVTALPRIATSFGTKPTTLTLAVTAYMIALAACVPASRWAADRLGAARVFSGAIFAFVLASLLSGLSTDAGVFLFARIAQGASAAFMSPVGQAVVLRKASPEELMDLVAATTWPGLIAPVVGPVLGGLLAAYASWRWIFFLNVPIGLAAAALALIWIPEHERPSRQPFDVLGFVLTAISLGCLVWGLDRLGRSEAVLAWARPAAISLVSGAAAVAHALRTKAPLLDLHPLSILSFRMGVATSGLLVRAAINAGPYLLPLMLQMSFGWDPFRAGVLMCVYMVGNLGMKAVTTPILSRFGFRPVLAWAMGGVALSLVLCGLLRAGTPPVLMWSVLVFSGATRSMTFTAWNTLSFSDVPAEHRGGAAAVSATLQQVAAAFGVAVAAAALEIGARARIGGRAAPEDFRTAFMVAAILAVIAVIWLCELPAVAGEHVRGRRRKDRSPDRGDVKWEEKS